MPLRYTMPIKDIHRNREQLEKRGKVGGGDGRGGGRGRASENQLTLAPHPHQPAYATSAPTLSRTARLQRPNKHHIIDPKNCQSGRVMCGGGVKNVCGSRKKRRRVEAGRGRRGGRSSLPWGNGACRRRQSIESRRFGKVALWSHQNMECIAEEEVGKPPEV